MIAFLILFVPPLILLFGLAFLFPRAATWLAWILGSLPALWLAAENTGTLANPLTWFMLLFFWLPPLAGALLGATLGRRLAVRRVAARSAP